MLKRAMKDAEMVGMKKNEKYLVMARDTVKALEERNSKNIELNNKPCLCQIIIYDLLNLIGDAII